jgi:hypothetical protein
MTFIGTVEVNKGATFEGKFNYLQFNLTVCECGMHKNEEVYECEDKTCCVVLIGSPAGVIHEGHIALLANKSGAIVYCNNKKKEYPLKNGRLEIRIEDFIEVEEPKVTIADLAAKCPEPFDKKKSRSIDSFLDRKRKQSWRSGLKGWKRL